MMMPWNSEALVELQYSLPRDVPYLSMTNLSRADLIMSLSLHMHWW